jgi:hypothetical protein
VGPDPTNNHGIESIPLTPSGFILFGNQIAEDVVDTVVDDSEVGLAIDVTKVLVDDFVSSAADAVKSVFVNGSDSVMYSSDLTTIPCTTKRVYFEDGSYIYMKTRFDSRDDVKNYYGSVSFELYYVTSDGSETYLTSGGGYGVYADFAYYYGDYDVSVDPAGNILATVYSYHIGYDNYFYNGILSRDVSNLTSKISIPESSIDTVTDDTTSIPLNPDGTVTMPNGTVIEPNSDGTYTIGDNIYTPGVDTGAINNVSVKDLVEYVLTQENEGEKDKEKAVDTTLTWADDDVSNPALDDSVSAAVDSAVAEYDGSMSDLVLSSGIASVFPFCLPFDFVRGVKLFSSDAVKPVFVLHFKLPAFGDFPGLDEPILLDFSDEKYAPLIVLCRWLTTISFVFTLIGITPSIVKGASS